MAHADETYPKRLGIDLPHSAEAVATSRRFFAEHASALRRDLFQDGLLLVSEIVTNAITHGAPDITLHLFLAMPGVRISVTDHGPDFPTTALTLPEPTNLHGRGLILIDAIASDWGVHLTQPPPGKTVWVELSPSA
jgi:anti-sigma regulatory factor (Ser/Thr protein kinase)